MTVHLRPSFRVVALTCLYAALLGGGMLFGTEIADVFQMDAWPHSGSGAQRTILLILLAYTVLIALPFVPGVEIGLALIAMFGVQVVPIVYAATVAALVLSFSVGRLVPPEALAKGFHLAGMRRAARLVEEHGRLDFAARRARVEAHLPMVLRPWLLRYPPLTLLVLFNIPGNALIGGGGGIALVLGASRLISWPAFVFGVAIAVAPVPLALMVGAAM